MNNIPPRTFYRSRDSSYDGGSPPPFGGGGFVPQHYHPQQQQYTGGDMPVSPQIRVTAQDAAVFGQAIHDKLQILEPPRARAPRDFVSQTKPVEQLFKEDEASSANYATTVADDDVINVECGGRELVKIENWSDAGFPESLMLNIKRSKYIKPRQIQSTTIPLILDGYDVISHAETGCGKTAAYLIPIISECIEAKTKGTFKSDGGYPFCIILTPTRELVRQCYEQALKLAYETGVTVARSYGELPTRNNITEINAGCDILCISPGRFKHFSDEGCIGFNKLRYLVFDEGDHLLSSQFLGDIRPVLELPSFPSGKLRQTLFFSATFSEDILDTAKTFMRPEGCRALVSNHLNIVNKRCIQEFSAPESGQKFIDLVSFLRAELEKVEYDSNKFPRTLVFCNTREYCEKLANALCLSGINAEPLSGMRAQDLREKAFDDFRKNVISCLLVTDICARGIDIKELDLVVNYDMPHDYDTYVHRAGRVGRIREGKCISYVSLERNKSLLFEIQEAMKKSGHMVPPSLDTLLNQVQQLPAENQVQQPPALPVEETLGQIKETPASNAEEISSHAVEAVKSPTVAEVPHQANEAPADKSSTNEKNSDQDEKAPAETPSPVEETPGQVKEAPAANDQNVCGSPGWSIITPQAHAAHDDDDW